jgi:hypothetical protein
VKISRTLAITIRLVLVFSAFVVGWIVYMIAMMMTSYDGVLSMIFQPFMAAICSAIVVAVAVIVGLLLKVPSISRIWNATPLWAIALIVCSLLILCFGSYLGMVETYTDPQTKLQFQGLHSAAALGGYFALVFAIANWPLGR